MRRIITITICMLFITLIINLNYCPNHHLNKQWYHFGHTADSKYDTRCNNCNAELNINY